MVKCQVCKEREATWRRERQYDHTRGINDTFLVAPRESLRRWVEFIKWMEEGAK